ncbi:hypothetical protein ACIGO9_31410 [Nocardia asteroides]|uniref:hypothetical protein n=1 Tax=Nocardia asteroides TaxID=1824 RepID=UPI0037C8DD92
MGITTGQADALVSAGVAAGLVSNSGQAWRAGTVLCEGARAPGEARPAYRPTITNARLHPHAIAALGRWYRQTVSAQRVIASPVTCGAARDWCDELIEIAESMMASPDRKAIIVPGLGRPVLAYQHSSIYSETQGAAYDGSLSVSSLPLAHGRPGPAALVMLPDHSVVATDLETMRTMVPYASRVKCNKLDLWCDATGFDGLAPSNTLADRVLHKVGHRGQSFRGPVAVTVALESGIAEPAQMGKAREVLLDLVDELRSPMPSTAPTPAGVYQLCQRVAAIRNFESPVLFQGQQLHVLIVGSGPRVDSAALVPLPVPPMRSIDDALLFVRKAAPEVFAIGASLGEDLALVCCQPKPLSVPEQLVVERVTDMLSVGASAPLPRYWATGPDTPWQMMPTTAVSPGPSSAGFYLGPTGPSHSRHAGTHCDVGPPSAESFPSSEAGL